MSTLMPSRPETCPTAWKIAVVASLYNPTWVEGLSSHFRSELLTISPNAEISVHHVPGSFELPLAVSLLAQSKRFDAIAAFGVLLDGETAHATLVAQAITQALLTASLQNQVPVLHEVLLVKNAQQAEDRCLGTELNRGIEAARAAIRMMRTVRSIQSA
jgi:6,7-dimethyl-8-ribityllumazine synthase